MNKEQQISRVTARMEWWLAKRDRSYNFMECAHSGLFETDIQELKELYRDEFDRYCDISEFCHARYLAARAELKTILASC